jgi:hypothetical protein
VIAGPLLYSCSSVFGTHQLVSLLLWMLFTFCPMLMLCPQVEVPITERITLRLVVAEEEGLVQVYTLSFHDVVPLSMRSLPASHANGYSAYL